MPLTQLRMETKDYPPLARLDAWRTAIGRVFDVSVPTDEDGEVAASIQSWHLGDVVIGEVDFHAQEFQRSRSTLLRSPMDHFLIQFYRRGGYEGQTDTHALYCQPGEVSWLDLTRTVHTRAKTSSTVSLLIPHDVLRAALPEADILHGRIVYGPFGRLLGEYLEATLRALPAMTQDDAPCIVNALCEMTAACTRPKREALMRVQPQIDRTRLEQARRFIEQHLLSANLSVERLCGELLISRRQAYRLFEHLGGIAHYIQRRRLAHAYAALMDSGSPIRISSLATRYGFSGESIFSKAFRREFGLSPSDVRDAGRSGIRRPRADGEVDGDSLESPLDTAGIFSAALGRWGRALR